MKLSDKTDDELLELLEEHGLVTDAEFNREEALRVLDEKLGAAAVEEQEPVHPAVKAEESRHLTSEHPPHHDPTGERRARDAFNK